MREMAQFHTPGLRPVKIFSPARTESDMDISRITVHRIIQHLQQDKDQLRLMSANEELSQLKLIDGRATISSQFISSPSHRPGHIRASVALGMAMCFHS